MFFLETSNVLSHKKQQQTNYNQSKANIYHFIAMAHEDYKFYTSAKQQPYPQLYDYCRLTDNQCGGTEDNDYFIFSRDTHSYSPNKQLFDTAIPCLWRRSIYAYQLCTLKVDFVQTTSNDIEFTYVKCC